MNRAPPPGASSTDDLAAHAGDELGDDGQADADAAGLEHGVAAAPVEAGEHPLALLGRDAGALVAHLELSAVAAPDGPTATRIVVPGGRELHGVGEQVRGDALEAVDVTRRRRRRLDVETPPRAP